jgi:hypothetical protein
LKVGDVVLVGADNKKRWEWPMAKILELIPGKDGTVRVAKIKTSTGEWMRPLQRLYPMEVSSAAEMVSGVPVDLEDAVDTADCESEMNKDEPKVVTRFGREVKKPKRFQ